MAADDNSDEEYIQLQCCYLLHFILEILKPFTISEEHD
jgi:hypothetical protein